MCFQFIIALVIAEHILHSTVYLSTFLQDTDYDILEAIEESNTVIEMLRAERQKICNAAARLVHHIITTQK
jgi:hypothetical protein